MNYEQIESFLSIASYGTVSAAADSLYVSQSTVSTRLAQLEEELGSKLILRGKGVRKTELTAFGREFVPIATQWAVLYRETFSLSAGNDTVTIRIASVDAVNNYTFVPLFKEHLENYPDIRLSIATHHSNEIHRLLSSREADVGFVFSQISYPDIISVPIYRELMYLICHKDSGYFDGISCMDLERSEEIYLRWGPDYQIWHDAHFSPAESPLITVNTGSMLQRYLDVPGRWSIAPLSVIQGAIRSNHELTYCSIKEPPDPRICYMLVNRRPDRTAERAIEVFRNEIINYIERDEDICTFEKWMLP